MYKRLKLTASAQRGDTLVEVLIAIAVVSLILGGAYVTTNRSLLATRAAQERGIALKLAESQIEQLKAIVANNPSTVFQASAPSPFCVSTAGAIVATTHVDCAIGSSGVATTVEPVFRISIVRVGNSFTLNETWANVNGKTTDNLQLIYRVYE